jgi:SAM-dependent methyltransferase
VFYRYYDALFAGKDYTGEIERALALAGIRRRGARILEIGAGTGNHTIACAKLGHEVVGVEIDPRMVALAQQKCTGLEPELAKRIRYFHGRVEELPDAGFELALALFNVINYIGTLGELESFFSAIARRVQPGAPFVFDAWNGVAALLDPPRAKRSQSETDTHRIDTSVTTCTDAMALCTTLQYVISATDKATGAVEVARHELAHTLWPAKVVLEAAAGTGWTALEVHPLNDPARAATERDWKILFTGRRG